MISYFPTPYENELLYSLIARYHYHSGHQSKRETLLKLFGHSRRFDVDLPKGIDSIVKVKRCIEWINYRLFYRARYYITVISSFHGTNSLSKSFT